MMEVGLVGKPNVGKSTFFAAATLAPAEIADYPFTTIKPNRGVAFVRAPCPHVALGLPGCSPKNASCVDGTRFVPVEAIDVAGLVPKAHEGRGLGNKFLDDLRQATALLHIVDASGSTDEEGRPVPPGSHDPGKDVEFLVEEVTLWIRGILERDFDTLKRKMSASPGTKPERILHEKVAGLGVTEAQLKHAIDRAGLDAARLATEIRTISKPVLVVANKADKAPREKVDALRKVAGGAVPASAESELALRRAAEKGIVRYRPGDADFTVLAQGLNEKQTKALEYIRTHVLAPYGSTGVQAALEESVYRLLDRIVVFPVEDDHHYTDKSGNVLPDAHLVPRGTTARELAFRVHTDLGEHFVRAVDAKTKRVIGADHVLAPGDVVRIVASK
ncbi:MAG: redox-regulated ATPase YchF [Methanobacteriota archaeon]